MDISAISVRKRLVVPLEGQQLPATFITFDGMTDGLEHFAIALGPFSGQQCPLVRIHSECVTGDVFKSRRCDCGSQLDEALHVLSSAGGYILYLRQEGRGIGFNAKMDAYHLQDMGIDTFEANRRLGHLADARSFAPAAGMLRALGISSVQLLTNNPAKTAGLCALSIKVDKVIPTRVYLNPHNHKYLESKVLRAGHHMSLTDWRTWR
jgi:GTP cyclohydrolase II